MNRHLVPIEVGIEGSTYQRMQLDRLVLNQNGLKGLDSETMEGRRAVQHHGMIADDILQNIPNLILLLLDHLLGRLDIARGASLNQNLHDKGLEELQRHLLGNTALVDL